MTDPAYLAPWDRIVEQSPIARFFDIYFRGAGQVFFQSNPPHGPREAAYQLEVGTAALQRVAAATIPLEAHPAPIERISVARAQFDAAYDRLAAAGVPLKPDRERAWRDFAALRARYDQALIGLTKEVEAPLVPWPTR